MLRKLVSVVVLVLLGSNAFADNLEEFQKWTKVRSEKSSPTFSMEFMLKHVREALTLNSLKNMAAAPSKRIPSQRLEATTPKNSVLVSGTDLRVDLHLPVLDHDTEKLVVKQLVSTQNQSEIRRAQLSTGTITSQNSSGLRMPSKSESLLDYNIFYPLLLALRGDDSTVCLYTVNLFVQSASSKLTKINGKDCYELTAARNRTNDGTALTLWCCPAEQHLPIRVERTSTDGSREIMDIENRTSLIPDGSFMPAAWTCDTFDKSGKAQKSYKVVVSGLDIAAKSTPSDFELVYPVGITISDLKSGKQYLVDDSHQLVEIVYDKNGNIVQVDNSGPRLFGIPLWPLLAGIVIGILLACLFLYAKRRTAKK